MYLSTWQPFLFFFVSICAVQEKNLVLWNHFWKHICAYDKFRKWLVVNVLTGSCRKCKDLWTKGTGRFVSTSFVRHLVITKKKRQKHEVFFKHLVVVSLTVFFQSKEEFYFISMLSTTWSYTAFIKYSRTKHPQILMTVHDNEQAQYNISFYLLPCEFCFYDL
jgi:hypothetical protein